MTNEAPVRKKVPVLPFQIEIDHHTNSDTVIQCIPGTKLRSALKASRTVQNFRNGMEMVPEYLSYHLSTCPPAPGQRLRVDPIRGTYEITDPLNLPQNEALCERLRLYLKSKGENMGTILRGVPTKSGKLDQDLMKTLCREMLCIVQKGDGQVTDGILPTITDIEDMPGEFLLNPNTPTHWHQPRYEKDLPAWEQKLNSLG